MFQHFTFKGFNIGKVFIAIIVLVVVGVFINNYFDSRPLYWFSGLVRPDLRPSPITSSSSSSTLLAHEEDIPQWQSNFSEPYPLSYKSVRTQGAGAAEVSLTGASLGKFTVGGVGSKVYPLRKDDLRELYQSGGKVFVLQLKFKVAIGNTGCPSSIVQTFRRFLPGTGDLTPPNSSEFYFMNCIDSTFNDQRIVFVIPETEREFILTNGGASPIFFKLRALSDGTIKFENFETPAKYKNATIGIQSPVSPYYPPSQLQPASNILWTYPSSDFSIARGETLTLKWDAPDYAKEYVRFSLENASSESELPYMGFKAQNKMGTSTIIVPAGTYTLRQTYPVYPKILTVTVIGPGSIASTSTQIYFEGSDTIIANRRCTANLVVEPHDQFGYLMKNATVTVTSNRSDDSIVLVLELSDSSSGYYYFDLTSGAPGNATLTVSVNGVELPKKLFLKVLDSNQNNCPDDVNRNSGDGGY